MLDRLVHRAGLLCDTEHRAVLGIVGCPGAGKSTLVEQLVQRLGAEGRVVVHVPMDGFHLADRVLDGLGRRGRKGAIDTFDAHGYLAMLHRVCTELTNTVYVPHFDRTIEQPVAGAIGIEPDAELVITEGNYLLADVPPWPRARQYLTEVWYCDLDAELRRARLLARHRHFGKSATEARRWVHDVDEPNASRVAESRAAADVVIDMSTLAMYS